MHEMGVEGGELETPKSRKKKRSGDYCPTAGLDYLYYEEIVDIAFERLDLPEHIPGTKKTGEQKVFLISSNQAACR